MKAKKSYGQHFLTSEVISERIANSLSLTETYNDVLEVGPGQGMLTKYLLEKDYTLKVVEADRDMVAYLNANYPQLSPNIIGKDFLKMRLEEEMGDNFAIIGNFPYNISSQIVFKMVACRQFVPEMVGMFQKEMAERIVAPPGNKTYGVISVLTQAFYDGKLLFNVKPGSFNPPPKVMSAVIRLTRKPDYENLGCDHKRFRQVVKLAFGQRRKMLRNTMKPLIKGSSIMENPIFRERPEQLSVQDFIGLTNMVEEVIEAQKNKSE
ncbi:MAG: 16S rRNA (adenine(1518)-N(6)/adenine(1519)-N(6))-dimethyltransferase RsmA [Saprospiraceae bacterium]